VTDHQTSFFPEGRDRGVTVAVEGFFAFVWFGWGQAAPPSWLVVPLGGRQFLDYALGYDGAYGPARAGASLEPVVPGVPRAAQPGLVPARLPANLLGTPAAAVPAGMAEGLPVGVQVMGGKYTELRCLAVAEAIEQRLGTLTPIEPVTS
jgi:hypothetical protein